MEKIIELSKGNPGAMRFLISLASPDNLLQATVIIPKLEETSIRGTDMYVLWNDLCDRDVDKVYNLCINCPIMILEDACSRQDRSGKELVKEYLEPIHPLSN